MGHPARFQRGSQFRSFTGLVPKASETGDIDRKGQPMSKAAPRCCAPRWSAPPTPPPSKTPSSPGPTTCRWSSEARTTSAPSASSPPTSPSGPGPSCSAACLRHLRQRRSTDHRRRGQNDHRRALDCHRRGPRPPAQQEGGECPSTRAHSTGKAKRSKRPQTRRPSPTSIIVARSPNGQAARYNSHLTTDPP
ncbi:MAG: hypothetical protein GEV08_05440 [Acidimicrobiia bacterium]|nr:hypothetical protein [Acidimicrobiia bacterium]